MRDLRDGHIPECFGALIGYPTGTGAVHDPAPLAAAVHERWAAVRDRGHPGAGVTAGTG